MNEKLMIEPPTPERQAQRIVDAFGYHYAESIPTSEVLKMLVAYQGFETRNNAVLWELINEFQTLSIKPVVVRIEGDKKV